MKSVRTEIREALLEGQALRFRRMTDGVWVLAIEMADEPELTLVVTPGVRTKGMVLREVAAILDGDEIQAEVLQ